MLIRFNFETIYVEIRINKNMGNEHFGTEDMINRPEIQEGIEKSNKFNMFR